MEGPWCKTRKRVVASKASNADIKWKEKGAKQKRVNHTYAQPHASKASQASKASKASKVIKAS